MAFNAQEQEIIKAGVQAGKSRAEIEQALTNYRTGVTPKQTVTPAKKNQSSPLQDQVKAIAGTERQGRVAEIVDAARSGQGALSTGLQLGGEVVRGAAESVANLPVIKQGFELLSTGIQKLSETKPIKAAGEAIEPMTSKVVQFYESLTPEQKRNVEATLEILSAIPVGKAAKVSLDAAESAVKAGTQILSKGDEFLSGIALKGGEGIKQATASALDPAAIMQRVARVSKGKQAAFQEMTGESVGQYLVDRGIFGNVDEITQQLYKRYTTSMKNVDNALAKLEGEYKNTSIGNALKQLVERERRVSSPGSVSPDLERVIALQKKHNGSGLTMEEINNVKRLYERNVRLDYVKENLPEKVAQANNVDSAIRKWQADQAVQLGFKNLPELNRETQAARQLLDDLGAEYAGSIGNNAVTLTDWIVLAGGEPSSVGGFLVKKALSSKGIMSKVAKLLAPEAKKGLPKAEMGESTIDNYLKFLKATEGQTTTR